MTDDDDDDDDVHEFESTKQQALLATTYRTVRNRINQSVFNTSYSMTENAIFIESSASLRPRTCVQFALCAKLNCVSKVSNMHARS